MTDTTKTDACQELKPCPCCGHSHEVHCNEDGRYVMCGTCGLSTRDFDTVSEAITAWNMRAEPPRGWMLVPVEPTAEMLASCITVVLPQPSAQDMALSRDAAAIVSAHLTMEPYYTIDQIAALIVPMINAYRVMLAAVPAVASHYGDEVPND